MGGDGCIVTIVKEGKVSYYKSKNIVWYSYGRRPTAIILGHLYC